MWQMRRLTPHSNDIGEGQVMEAGQTYFNRYQVHRKLGQGTYGIVWLADDHRLGRPVAIKELTDRQHEIAQRLVEEARAAAQTRHPNIVHVYDVKTDPSDELPRYVVMEYLDGGTLRQRLHQQGRLVPQEAFEIALDVCQGLRAAHSKERPIIHGDIKPDNILFDEWGVVRITDFGAYLPRQLGGQSYRPAGTPLYQTPQLLLGEAEATIQDDLYAVVVMLYEMLCGSFVTQDRQLVGTNFYLYAETPIQNPGVLFTLFVKRAPLVLPRERNPGLLPELDSIFVKGLAYEPGDRYQTIEELIGDLDQALQLCRGVVEDVVPPVSDAVIQRIAACLRHGWMADPQHEGNPYDVMETLFVGPRSSMHDIQSCSPAQMTEPQRAAWRQLRELSTRLFVDSFMYRVEQGRELVAKIREHWAVHHQLPAVDWLPPSLRQEWPLVLLLEGKREECLAVWTDVQHTGREHTAPNVVHSLAVAYTFLAQQQEREAQFAAAIASWRQALAHWAWVLTQDDYWAAWAATRSRCYQVRITPQHLADLKGQLRDYFEERFADPEGRVLPPDCPMDIRQAYQELGLEWQIEWAGLQAWKRLQAGQPDPHTVDPAVGPALVTEFGLEESLARFVLERTQAIEDVVLLLTSSVDAQQVRQDLQDVRLYYSRLGRTAAWLNLSQPERALAAIPVEAPDADLGAPYRLLPDGQRVWERDRGELTMRTHLQLASQHLQRKPWDVEAVKAQWTEVLSLGSGSDDVETAVSMIEDQALAYLEPEPTDPGRRAEQLALAEAARGIVGPTVRLESALKKLRGADRPAKKAPAASPPDLETLLGMDSSAEKGPDLSWQEQVTKLDAVLRVNPTDEDAREQLAHLVVERLEQLIEGEEIETARHIADEWHARLEGHPLLQAPYRYLQDGYKVAAFLGQTDLVYRASLLQAYTYELPWRMDRTDDVVLQIKVEGDLVRISAPLPRSTQPFSAEMQRNLLLVTASMPLYKVFRRPNGEAGLMAESLAAWLTPALLKQLVHSLARRVNLPGAHLKSLHSLQRVMDEVTPDLSLRAGGLPTERDFERWQGQLLARCRRMDLECTLAEGFAYRLKRRAAPGEPILLDFQAPVVTFEARLGGAYRQEPSLYERMMEWNDATALCKLALTPDDAVVLRCEALDWKDEEIFRLLTRVFEALAQSESWLAWHAL